MSTNRQAQLQLERVGDAHQMSIRGARRVMILVLAFAMALAVSSTGRAVAQARAAAPLVWSGPLSIDSAASTLEGVSCASTSLCVAVDRVGNVVSSTDPAGGSGAWSAANVDATNAVGAVSCTPGLCVAVDTAGNVLSSTEPTGGVGAWMLTNINGGHPLNSVSCASTSLCIATDGKGDLLTTTNPRGGAGAWKVTNVDGANAIHGVSCPSVSLCVAVDGDGNVLSSTEPSTGGWKITNVAGSDQLLGVSCVSGPLCVVVDAREGAGEEGDLLTSTDPTGGAGAWTLAPDLKERGSYAVSCASASLCVALGGRFDSPKTAWASTNPTGGTGAWAEAYPGESTDVACPSPSLCVAVGSGGNMVVGVQAHELSAALLGSGAGTVRSTAISCPFATCSYAFPKSSEPRPITMIGCEDTIGSGSFGVCALSYPAGNEVTLTASPSPGSIFSGWGGACSGTSSSCAVAMSSDRAVAATFMPGSTSTTSNASAFTTSNSSADLSSSPPRFTDVRQSAKRWHEGSARARISAAQGKLALGTTFSFILNERASVTFTFTESVSGRKVGKVCTAQNKTNKRESRCTRTIVAATMTLRAHAGANKVSFMGRVSQHRKLEPGRYRLLLTAVASGRRSTPSTLDFTIVNR